MGNSFIPEDWAEILRTKGIWTKGYGLIPKYAMQDCDLKIAEKGLYAYLCSLAGNEFEAYPSVSTIKTHLQIGDKAYSSYMKALIETGYISRESTRSEGHRFDKNLYHLSQQPKKFFLSPPLTPKGEVIRNTIRAGGLLGGGYGFVTRMFTFDQRLDIKTKALYAYLAAFTGAGECAFPCREQIIKELSISKTLYYNCLNRLLELNYITIERDKVRNFERNRYVLNHCPDDSLGPQRIGSGILDTSQKSTEESRPNLAGTGKEGSEDKTPVISTVSKVTQESISDFILPKQGHVNNLNLAGTALAGTEMASTALAGTIPAGLALASPGEEGTNNITSPINTVSKSSFEKYQSYLSFPESPSFNRLRQKYLYEIDRIDRLPREELASALLEWFSLRQEDFGDLANLETIDQAQAILNIITDFLASKRPLQVRGISVSHEEFLTRILQMDQNDLLVVGERVAQYIASNTVGNPITYTLCAVYNQAIAGQLDPNSRSL